MTITAPQNHKRIIAFDVRPRRFGFAVFEGPNEVLDFGARSFPKGRSAVRVSMQKKLATLFTDFDPAVVVLRGRMLDGSKRESRIAEALQKEALERAISVRFVTPGAVGRAFAGHNNKHEIASTLAQQFPALASKLPPKRKIWQSEAYRTSIFDASALGITYFFGRKPTQVESITQTSASPDHDFSQRPSISHRVRNGRRPRRCGRASGW